MRNAVQTIPDGVYTFEDVLDDDGYGTYDIPITVRIEVVGDRIRLDFTGTAPQVPGKRQHRVSTQPKRHRATRLRPSSIQRFPTTRAS